MAAGVGGFFSQSKTKEKSSSEFWTPEQKKVAASMGKWLEPQVGTGLTPYTGVLPGTQVNPTMSNLFSGAAAYSRGENLRSPWLETPGSNLFSHYQMYTSPQEREARVQETLAARRRLLAPTQEKEDSLLRSKMQSMGLQHSSDTLKYQMDLKEKRRAEEDSLALGLLDKYEALGYQAGEDALTRISEVSQMQYTIQNAGLQAMFDEWKRQQPEYNPMIDIVLSYLGLQGVADTEGKIGTTSWGVSGSASYAGGGGAA